MATAVLLLESQRAMLEDFLSDKNVKLMTVFG